jgi:hypothetical protein
MLVPHCAGLLLARGKDTPLRSTSPARLTISKEDASSGILSDPELALGLGKNARRGLRPE